MAVINGRAKRFDGLPVDYVLIFKWRDGRCLAKCVPDSAGNWSFNYEQNIIVGITYVANGCEPMAHGPYEFVVQK